MEGDSLRATGNGSYCFIYNDETNTTCCFYPYQCRLRAVRLICNIIDGMMVMRRWV